MLPVNEMSDNVAAEGAHVFLPSFERVKEQGYRRTCSL